MLRLLLTVFIQAGLVKVQVAIVFLRGANLSADQMLVVHQGGAKPLPSLVRLVVGVIGIELHV